MDIDSAWSHLKVIYIQASSALIIFLELNSLPLVPQNVSTLFITSSIVCIPFNHSPTPHLLNKLHVVNLEQTLQDSNQDSAAMKHLRLHQNCKAIHWHLNLITSSSTTSNQVRFNNFLATNSLDKTNLFNEYFHSVYAPIYPHLSQLPGGHHPWLVSNVMKFTIFYRPLIP